MNYEIVIVDKRDIDSTGIVFASRDKAVAYAEQQNDKRGSFALCYIYKIRSTNKLATER